MNITIRTRLLRNGNQAIYFDCEDSGRRWQERSGFYLIDGYDAKTKRLNRDAMDKAVDLRSRRILGLEAESPGDKSETTVKGAYFSEWLDGYLEEVRKNPMRNRGYYNNVRATANLVTAYLKKRRRPRMAMKSVNAGFIRGFLRFIKEDYRHHYHGDKPLSDSTIYAHQLRLSQILDHAVRDGVLRSNPLRSLHKRERLRKPSYDRDYLTREELERMGNAACGNDDVKRAYMFCCHSGLRFSDVKALCWKSLRFSKDGVNMVLPMKKTGKQLVVPLTQKAISWLPKRKDKTLSAKVFPAMPELRNCETHVKKMAVEAGIKKNVSWHISRHTFAVLAKAAGVDLYTISKLLGHSSLGSTQIYADVQVEAKTTAVDLLDFLSSGGK